MAKTFADWFACEDYGDKEQLERCWASAQNAGRTATPPPTPSDAAMRAAEDVAEPTAGADGRYCRHHDDDPAHGKECYDVRDATALIVAEAMSYCGPLREFNGGTTTYIFGFDFTKAIAIITRHLAAMEWTLNARTIELERQSRETQKWNNRANQLAIEIQDLRAAAATTSPETPESDASWEATLQEYRERINAMESDPVVATADNEGEKRDGSMSEAQLQRAALIAESREIDLETAQELVYLRDRVDATYWNRYLDGLREAERLSCLTGAIRERITLAEAEAGK